VASGEPPARPASTADGDDALPRERRDVAKKSSPMGPILIVGAIVVVVLCVCAAPAVLFFGAAVPFFAVGRQEAIHEAQAVRVAEENVAVAEKMAKAPDPKLGLQGFAKGAAEADDAIAKDKLLLKEYPPLPAPAWHGDYIKLLKERGKCDYQVINGKLAKDQEDEIKGWNETTFRELERRHGPMIIAEMHKEAEQTWRARIEGKDKK
jgi:hypothetical protein